MGIQIPGPPAGPTVGVVLAGASELADLASIFFDLIVAGMAAEQINESMIQGPEFAFLRRACWEGAIIAYARCFVGGQGATFTTRTRAQRYLAFLPADLRDAHERLLLLRNKRVGHHVAAAGGQSINLSAGVVFDQSTRLTGLGDMYVEVDHDFLYDLGLMHQLQEISRTLRDRIGARIDTLRIEVLHRLADDPNGVVRAFTSGDAWSP